MGCIWYDPRNEFDKRNSVLERFLRWVKTDAYTGAGIKQFIPLKSNRNAYE
jgi:hypothetical protein